MLSSRRKASSDNSDEADEKAMIASANLIFAHPIHGAEEPSLRSWHPVEPEPRRPQGLAAWWPAPPFAVALGRAGIALRSAGRLRVDLGLAAIQRNSRPRAADDTRPLSMSQRFLGVGNALHPDWCSFVVGVALAHGAPARDGGGPQPRDALAHALLGVGACWARRHRVQEANDEGEQDCSEHDIDQTHGILPTLK